MTHTWQRSQSHAACTVSVATKTLDDCHMRVSRGSVLRFLERDNAPGYFMLRLKDLIRATFNRNAQVMLNQISPVRVGGRFGQCRAL